MRIAPRDLTEHYSEALREYCAKGEEATLSWAFELGHRAASEGLGMMEMATMHEKALVEALLERLSVDETTCIAHRASEFLAVALAPFEKRHRRCQEEHSTLRNLNQGLEQWLEATQQTLDAAQDQLLELRKAEQRTNEFICVMSHEMHGSLTVLKSGLGGELNAHGQGLLDVALRNSERVTRLVSDSPDVQAIESDAMTFSGTRTAAAATPRRSRS